ncbi:hypothetical protein [Nocardia sp. NBC_00511]|uniref:hypothetical protein n=1 Tax=Nocardia sp. NBC_00511 TaxID=2903591 RepID=UPI0030E107E7
MACIEGRTATGDGNGDITVHWHETTAQVFLEITSEGPRVQITWMPTPETGMRVYLHLAETEHLADMLTGALITHAQVEADPGSITPDWAASPNPDGAPAFPLYFGPDAWPLEEF